MDRGGGAWKPVRGESGAGRAGRRWPEAPTSTAVAQAQAQPNQTAAADATERALAALERHGAHQAAFAAIGVRVVLRLLLLRLERRWRRKCVW